MLVLVNFELVLIDWIIMGTINKIFARNDINNELTQALLVMNEFYEKFHEDIFTYHCSTIAEFLNNLRWVIYDYLQPVYTKSLVGFGDDKLAHPPGIVNPFAQSIFGDLMNHVGNKPCMRKFTIPEFLKRRY